MKKILIISPHADDEILGCYGYMVQQIKQGAKVHVLFGAVGGVDYRQIKESRLKEIQSVAEEVGFTWDVIAINKDAEMDTIADRKIISYIDKVIAYFEPNEVFVNYPSRHQDHKKVYECTMAAMRLKEGFMPSFFALYEYPFITGIDVPNGGFMYVDITNEIDDKCRVFSLYTSQVKESPSPLNEGGIKALSRLRGVESGVMYAEMFYIQKMLVK